MWTGGGGDILNIHGLLQKSLIKHAWPGALPVASTY